MIAFYASRAKYYYRSHWLTEKKMLNVSPEKNTFLQLIDFLQFIVNCYMHPLHVELVGVEEHQYHNF